VHCAPTSEEANEVARESFEWYPQRGARIIASVGEWLEGKDLGTYSYAGDALQHQREGHFDFMTFDYLRKSGSAVVGDPDECIEACKRYEAAGCDLLLCLFNPYKIPHDKVMQSIELIGRHVMPEFA
jgi:alkanesulfonate monooxygenase SsuD/methylene tetrahydromethanopterin reductase-like flavin-dependent oxidoreductase (luciferase family)